MLTIIAKGDNRQRILIPGNVANTISRDIDANANLYVTTIDSEKVLLETTYKNGVRILFFIFTQEKKFSSESKYSRLKKFILKKLIFLDKVEIFD